MLKGKAIIELTDVNTGEKTTQVEHNIMTNALAEFFNPPLSHFGIESMVTTDGISSTPSTIAYLFAYDQPDLSWATSGIVVSNQAQEESPDNLEIPLSSIIGAAAKQYKTQIDDVRYGEYNEAESFIDHEHGIFNHVFDFPTSACNGTVRCLSIMHPGGVIGLPYAQYDSFKDNLDKVYRRKYFVGGEIATANSIANAMKFRHPIPGFDTVWTCTKEGTRIGTWTYKTRSYATTHTNLENLRTYEKVLAFDINKNCMYTMTWTDVDKFVVRCRESKLSSINAITNFKLIKEYPEITVTSQKTSTCYGIACVDKMTQKFHFITNYSAASSTVEPNKEMYVYEVDLIAGTTRTYTMGNSTGVPLYLTPIHTYNTPGSSTAHGHTADSAIVHNGNLYVTSTATTIGQNAVKDYRWYKIPLNNPSNVTECKPVTGFVPISNTKTLPKQIQLIDDRYLGICDGTTYLLLNVENDTIYNDFTNDYTIGLYSHGTSTAIPIIGSKFVMYTYSYTSNYNSTTISDTLGVSVSTRLDIPMTINNLSTPIHKTASQTMKITYVLKEVEPEEEEEGGETE